MSFLRTTLVAGIAGVMAAGVFSGVARRIPNDFNLSATYAHTEGVKITYDHAPLIKRDFSPQLEVRALVDGRELILYNGPAWTTEGLFSTKEVPIDFTDMCQWQNMINFERRHPDDPTVPFTYVNPDYRRAQIELEYSIDPNNQFSEIDETDNYVSVPTPPDWLEQRARDLYRNALFHQRKVNEEQQLEEQVKALRAAGYTVSKE